MAVETANPDLVARTEDDGAEAPDVDLSWLRGTGPFGGDDFVFFQATDGDRPILGGAGEDGGALQRHAVAVAAREALAAPVLPTLAAMALLLGMEIGADPLDTYTSGRGAVGRASGFNITIDFEGAWTASLKQRFVVAAEYLSRIITGDLRNRPGIDDIEITATLSEIDGAGGVLGQAGPTALRAASALPFRGRMEFDRADAAGYDGQGLFDDIVVHEMMHALGFGTVWDRMGLTDGATYLDGLIFGGRNARLAFKALFPELHDNESWFRRGVPLETDGGPGTAGGHWDEDTFHRELMTGYLDRRTYVSGLTVAALEDMGYRTVWDADHPHRAIPQPDDFL